MISTLIEFGAVAVAAIAIYIHRAYVKQVVAAEVAKAETDFVKMHASVKVEIAKIVAEAKADAKGVASNRIVAALETKIKKIL